MNPLAKLTARGFTDDSLERNLSNNTLCQDTAEAQALIRPFTCYQCREEKPQSQYSGLFTFNGGALCHDCFDSFTLERGEA